MKLPEHTPKPRGPRRVLPVLAGLLLLGAALLFFLSGEKETVLTTYSMGSYVRQTVYGGHGDEAAAAGARAVQELDELISWRVENSDVARLNSGGKEGLELDPRTWKILQVCRSVSRNSHGAFDPTVAPVSRLWDFDGEPKVPGETELAAALTQVDYHALSLPTEYEAVLAEGHSLDLGAVGKGAACDAVLESWKLQGVSRGVVAVGGSVGLYGAKPFGEPWAVAVRDPSGEGSLGTLSLAGGCVSTSGSYEKTFTEGGKTYHHLLDPKTGYPAESGLVSVTVWRGEKDGNDGAFTDALATACFVLGPEDGPALLDLFGAEGIFVTEGRQVFVTEGLKGCFSLTAAGYEEETLP